MNNENNNTEIHHTRRDAETVIILGLFLVFQAIPVIIGTYFVDKGLFYQAVNMISGLVILLIGVVLLLRGRAFYKENP